MDKWSQKLLHEETVRLRTVFLLLLRVVPLFLPVCSSMLFVAMPKCCDRVIYESEFHSFDLGVQYIPGALQWLFRAK
ncbi:hypothetical protein AV540_22230 [Brevibacillus parabrevis]|nr:hypothetical protein AV540_22230 [Brevibacillus parabrevis]